jgi:flagellar basal-body rod protein FlgG
LNEEGELVTKEGYPVLPKSYFQSPQPITIPPEAIGINVDKSGRIEYMDQTAFDTPVYDNELMVVRVDDLQALKPVGDNYFAFEGDPKTVLNIVEETDQVHQFALEKSNVNPVREMTALIETNRLVEMYQKAMQTQMNDMNQDAINKLAATRA